MKIQLSFNIINTVTLYFVRYLLMTHFPIILPIKHAKIFEFKVI